MYFSDAEIHPFLDNIKKLLDIYGGYRPHGQGKPFPGIPGGFHAGNRRSGIGLRRKDPLQPNPSSGKLIYRWHFCHTNPRPVHSLVLRIKGWKEQKIKRTAQGGKQNEYQYNGTEPE